MSARVDMIREGLTMLAPCGCGGGGCARCGGRGRRPMVHAEEGGVHIWHVGELDLSLIMQTVPELSAPERDELRDFLGVPRGRDVRWNVARRADVAALMGTLFHPYRPAKVAR